MPGGLALFSTFGVGLKPGLRNRRKSKWFEGVY